MNIVTNCYSEDTSFELLLIQLGLDGNEIARINANEFTNMLLVKHFTYNINGLKDHLSLLNKSVASATGARRVYFNPIMTNHLLGILYYFSHAYHTYHMIPDIDKVDDDHTDLHGTLYFALLCTKLDDKEAVLIKIPKLTGAKNW